VFPNEHYATGKSVQSVARKRVPAIAPVRTQDLDNRVEVVATSRVHRHASWLVNDDKIIILMHNSDGFRCYRRLVAVEGVGDHIAVLYDCLGGRNGLAVKHDAPFDNGFFLLKSVYLYALGKIWNTYIILRRSISKL
jgi:hypothetical protein